MKNIMPFFAAAIILTGAACNTYTASTDPATYATGYGFPGENDKVGTGNTGSMGVAEVNNNATFDNPATGANSDSMTANQNLDHLFMMNAASSGMLEVAAGKLAATKGKNAGVKKYGQMMVTDHTKSNTELQALAKAKGVTLPTALLPVHQQHLDMLSKLADLEFDKTYMQHMVEAHEMDIKLFDQEAKTGKDAEIKAFAAKNLPILQAHRKAAQPIFEEVGRDRQQAISR